MPVSSQISEVSYVGNASTVTPYVVTFRFDDDAWLKVEVTPEDGSPSLLTQGADYTISGSGTAVTASITTTAAIPATSTVRLYRDTPDTQLHDYVYNSKFSSASVESALDKLTMGQQDQDRERGRLESRAVRVPNGETVSVLPAADSRAGEIPYFNATTGDLETKTPDEILALSGGAPTGVGIPAGGTTGQVLRKTSGTDYAVEFDDPEVQSDGTGVIPDDFREALGASDTGESLFTAQDSAAARDFIAPFPGPFDSDGQAMDWGVVANRAYLGSDGQVHWVRGGTDPMTISGLTVAFDFGDEDTLFTDDGVTPAGEGDAVKRITDANGGALYLEQATAANRFTRNGSTLYPPAAPLGYSVSGAGIPFDWRTGTIVLIHAKRRTYTQVLSPATIYLDANYGAWASYASVRAHAGASGQKYVGGLYDDALNFWAGSFGATSSRFMSNRGTRTDIVWPATGAVNLTKLFARVADDFAPWNAPLRAVYFYNRALTEEEMASIREWHALSSLDIVIQAIGDSITQGYVATDISTAWPSRIVANRAWSIINSGLASHRASQAVTDINWRNQLYETGKTNIALIWLGTNDMQLSSAAPATVWANLQSFCNSLKAAHADWKLILATTLPRTDGIYTPPVGYPGGTTFDDVRAELNSSIRTGYAAVADGIADFAADPDIGANGASNSTAFFNADKVHLNNDGQIRVASIAQAAIDALL